MIRSALAAFMNASELPGIFPGFEAFVFNEEFVFSEHPIPRATIAYIGQSQKLWVIGDAQREEDVRVQVTISVEDFESKRQIRSRFQRLIENAYALDSDGASKPGIDFLISGDLLRNGGDNLNYFSEQPAWFASPVPKVFKNLDSNGNPIIVGGGYSIDYANGKVVFGAPNAPSDIIRASYKVGIIDFNIANVAEPQIVDQENQPSKFNVVFDLVTHFYIKAIANRYL